MEKHFVPYDVALKLKEIGFKNEYNFKEYDTEGFLQHTGLLESLKLESIDAPLWQQAFDWFRDTYQTSGEIYKQYPHANTYYNWCYAIPLSYDRGHDVEGFETYEEARLECLKMLIETVPKK